MPELLHIGPNQTDERTDLLSINQTSPVPVDAKEADAKAGKYDYALGAGSPGVSALTSQIQAGMEERVRQRAAQTKDIQDFETRNQKLIELAKEKGPVDPAKVAKAQAIIANVPNNDPSSIMEKLLGETVVGKAVRNQNFQDNFLDQQFPERTAEAAKFTAGHIAKNEWLSNFEVEKKKEYDRSSWGGYIADTAKRLLPGYSEFKLSNIVLGAPDQSMFLPGKGMAESVAYQWALPPDEFMSSVRRTYDALAQDNLPLAQEYLSAVRSYTTGDRAAANFSLAFDLATAVSPTALLRGGKAAAEVGAAGARAVVRKGESVAAASAQKMLPKAMADVAEAAARTPIDKPRLAEVTEGVSAGAKVEAREITNALFTEHDPLRLGRDMSLPDTMRPEVFFSGESRVLSSERAGRIVQQVTEKLQKVYEDVGNLSLVRRLTPQALEQAYSEAEKVLTERYTSVGDAVLNARFQHHAPDSNAANTGIVEMQMGRPDGTLFDSPKEAYRTATVDYGLSAKDVHSIQPNGTGGFYISIIRPIDETSAAVRKLNVATEYNQTPKSLTNAFFGWAWRSADQNVSQFQNENRKTALQGIQAITEAMQNIASDLKALDAFRLPFTKSERKDLSRIMEINRDTEWVDEKGVNRRGFFYDNVKDLEDAYLSEFDRLPSEREIRAYYAARSLNDFDYFMRNLTIYRDKVRQGIEKFDFQYADFSEQTHSWSNVNLSDITKQTMDGKYVDDIPWDVPEDAGIAILHGEEGNRGRTFKKNTASEADRAEIAELQKRGYKLIQVANPTSRPLSPITGEEVINFVLARKHEVSPQTWEQLPYRPGFHVEYTDPYFVKQPRIARLTTGSAPPVPEGHVRLYRGIGNNMHGGVAGQGGSGANLTWYTTKKDRAARYGAVHYVDVPNTPESLKRFAQGTASPDDLVSDSEDLVRGLRPYTETGTTHRYDGDVSMLGARTENEAARLTQYVETGRQLLKDGKTAELREHLKNGPFSYEKFWSLFQESVDPKTGRITPPLFNKDDSFYSVGTGRYTIDDHKLGEKYAGLEDSIRSPYNLFASIDKEYAGQRNIQLWGYDNLGTEQNPVHKLGQARLLDPLSTLNRSMANVMRNRYMQDYKMQASEAFVEEFSDLFKVPKEDLQANLIYYLHQPPWDTANPNTGRLAQAKSARMALLNLLGSETELGKAFSWAEQKMNNLILDKLGTQGYDKFVRGVDLPLEKDPLKIMRNFAFHTKLGLFNLVQFGLQAQTMGHVIAVAGPVTGTKGAVASTLMMGARLHSFSDASIAAMGKVASRLGVMSKEEFAESWDALKRTGFHVVGTDHTWREDLFDPKVFTGTVGRFLDKGAMFFNEGERVTRFAAWNAAYLEWKKANPTRVLDNTARAKILNRADDLSLNMTRASNASWQQGIFSVPTQFLSYQARMMEQLLPGYSSKLTAREKAQAYATYAAFYGVPGLGAATTGISFYEDIKQAALERGVNVSDPFLYAFNEGLISSLVKLTTGREYSFSKRMGPGGIASLGAIADFTQGEGEKGLAQILVGPSGTILFDSVRTAYPVLTWASNPFRPPENKYVLTKADLIDAFSFISSVKNVNVSYMMGNVGMYMTSKGVPVDHADAYDAAVFALLGVEKMSATDTWAKMGSLKDAKKTQDVLEKEIKRTYRLAFRAQRDGDDKNAEIYLNRIRLQLAAGNFNPIDSYKILREVLSADAPLVDSINERFQKKFNK